MIEALEYFGLDKITDVANFVYESENVPDEMIELMLIALPKKPETTDCKAHRTITLMSHVTNIILRVILNRIRVSLEKSYQMNSLDTILGRNKKCHSLSTSNHRKMH